jgi:hypothetical protein
MMDIVPGGGEERKGRGSETSQLTAPAASATQATRNEGQT